MVLPIFFTPRFAVKMCTQDTWVLFILVIGEVQEEERCGIIFAYLLIKGKKKL